jgi:hypothetical protein
VHALHGPPEDLLPAHKPQPISGQSPLNDFYDSSESAKQIIGNFGQNKTFSFGWG